jgi:8-oxo-dGTP diphosphatase
MGMIIKYCPMCTTPLREQLVFERTRQVCPQCGFIHFEGPKVAAGVIPMLDGRVLLSRRAIHPRQGTWNFPAGYVDLGESVAEAAVREVKEETNVDVRIDRLVGVYSRAEDGVVLVAYAGTIVGGEPCAMSETSEVGFFFPGDYPELAFWATRQALEDWEKTR